MVPRNEQEVAGRTIEPTESLRFSDAL